MATLTARDIIARDEVTLTAGTDIYGAVQQLLANKLTEAAVVDDQGARLGMVTERECLKVLVGGALDGLPSGHVNDYMISPAQSVALTASIYDIVHVFLTGAFRKLPVVDQGRVVGQVSRWDALVALASLRDNARLYGTDVVQTPDGAGVDSAMRSEGVRS